MPCRLAVLAVAFLLAATPLLAAKGKPHWAFTPPGTVTVPTVQEAKWVRNPIDAFILAKLEAEGQRPNAPAPRLALLRRAHLTLTGLPPTPAEQDAFLADESADALDKVVAGLLNRPEYGERWGRHWLDVARYAESNGYERDGTKPNAWRYRDYVIESLNKDKPFDRFIVEQIAGDELPDASAETQTATTFLRLGTWDDEPAEPEMDRYDQLDDVLGVTTTAFLAQTIRCARCHDHKSEPFTQADYYRLLAVFQPLKRPRIGRAEFDVEVGSAAELDAIRAARDRHKEQADALRADLDRLAKVVKELPGPSDADAERLAEAQRRLKEHEAAGPPKPLRAYVFREETTDPPPTRILRRGNPSNPQQEVGPGVPAVLVAQQPAPPKATERTTGRRLWLARWIASPDNPLTARVIVNRVWAWHFGRGIVSTANDFGTAGESPTHPELLDWLAREFIRSGWSLKALHRLILGSNTWRVSAVREADDPDPARRLDLFGRSRLRRLEAEAVRDDVLSVSGRLNLQRGGPSVFPPLPRAVLEGQSRPGDGWGKSDERQAARRSVYVFAKRSLAVPELDLLDAPDTTSPCEARLTSTTAPQALTLLNGAFFNDHAGQLADRLAREAGDDLAARVRLAYRLTLCRPPEPAEERLALAFLERQRAQIEADARKAGMPAADAGRRALAAFCLVLLNTNEFAYPW